MNTKLKEELFEILKQKIESNTLKDLAHDSGHAYRVLNLAVQIAKKEKADIDIIVPAALFHDSIVYKGTEKYPLEHVESADFARNILESIKDYPKEKIEKVAYAITICSYSKGITPITKEAMVLQDADLLESTGAIGIMRSFASAVKMHAVSLYNIEDPFCERRVSDPSKYTLDLFFQRLMRISYRLHTQTAKKIAKRRDRFLKLYISELRKELEETSRGIDVIYLFEKTEK